LAQAGRGRTAIEHNWGFFWLCSPMASEMELETAQLGAQIVNGQADLELLKSTIMSSIDSKLSHNEESMWRRGLKEIKRLQTEQQEVLSVVGDLQDKQEALTTENQQLRKALCDVTAKFEQVVNEMRQGLRQLSQRGSHHGQVSPSPSAASTAASDAATPGLGGLLHATELAQGRVLVGHLERALQRYGPLPESFEEAWGRLVNITEKARLVTELNSLIESRLKVSSKVEDSRDECRTLLVQYEDALRKLHKATLLVLDTQQPGQAAQDESFTEPTPSSSKGNVSMSFVEPTPPSSKGNAPMTLGFTPTWPTLAEDPGETFSTPPRGMSSEDPALLYACSQPWQGQYDPSPGFPGVGNASSASAPMAASPAAVLSLASALGPSSPFSNNAAASGGLKQLQLAECLAESTVQGNTTTPAASPATGLGVASPMALKYATPTHSPLKVELHKQPGFTTLGMEVNEENATAIRVQSIDERGLVGRHNGAQSSMSSKIHVGDLIVEINGISGDAATMLQECKSQQVLILTMIRGSSAGSPVPSTVPSPPAGSYSAFFPGSADSGEVDRVLAEISAPPASWGRLRPEAIVFVPSSTQAHGAVKAEAPLSSELLVEPSPLGLPTNSSTEGGAATGVANGSEDGLARLLFSP